MLYVSLSDESSYIDWDFGVPDVLWYRIQEIEYPHVGGRNGHDDRCGIFLLDMTNWPGHQPWHIGKDGLWYETNHFFRALVGNANRTYELNNHGMSALLIDYYAGAYRWDFGSQMDYILRY